MSLGCPRCGIRLEVYEDMTRFACGSCGAEVMVQRRGGTIALKVFEEPASVRAAEKTHNNGSELALLGMTAELARLVDLLAEPSLAANARYALQMEISRVTERIADIRRLVNSRPPPVPSNPSGPEISCMRCGKAATLHDSVCQNCGMTLGSGRVKILVKR